MSIKEYLATLAIILIAIIAHHVLAWDTEDTIFAICSFNFFYVAKLHERLDKYERDEK